MNRHITIGADPELFAFRGEFPISAHLLIPGTKHNPCIVPKGAIQADGVAAEFNIKAANSKKVFIKNIKHVRRILEEVVTARDKSVVLQATPTVEFNAAYFKTLPDFVKALGCEPDFNAYTKRVNPKPETKKPLRTGAGHIHVGWSDCDVENPAYEATVQELVKELDFTLYNQSVFWDKDEKRRELYGKPGAFRYKPYGFEYRVLSNAWLASPDDRRPDALIEFVFDVTMSTVQRWFKSERFYSSWEKFKKAAANKNVTIPEYLRLRNLPIVTDYVGEVPNGK